MTGTVTFGHFNPTGLTWRQFKLSEWV